MPGPGPRRGGFRPHQKVENPSLLLKRIISILFKSHPILLIISYICLIISAVSAVLGSGIIGLIINAIDEAAEGNFEKAEELIKEGQEAFTQGHDAHAQLLVKTAQGEAVTMDLLLTHAEDQLMSAEAFGILAERFVTLYKKLAK